MPLPVDDAIVLLQFATDAIPFLTQLNVRFLCVGVLDVVPEAEEEDDNALEDLEA